MKITSMRIAGLAVALLVPVVVPTNADEGPSSEHRRTGLTAKITLRDGTIQTATLDGLGCTASICSRTLIKGNGGLVRAWLDSIAAIQDTASDAATLVMKDGSRQQMFLMKDFRVLYLTDARGALQKVDLAKAKSVEFLW